MSAGTVGTKTTIAEVWIADANPGERTGSSRRSGLQAQWIWIGLLVLAAALPYLPTLGYGFVYDDMPQIVHNPDLVSLHNIPRFFTQFISKALGFHNTAQPVFYRPLFFSQLCLTRVLFGPGPFGFHLVSLLLHIGNTLLLYVLALRLGLRREAAKLAGLIFAVHPVHVECVVWPSASPDLMVLGATLVALLAFLRAQESGQSVAPRYGWWGVSLLAFTAGLFVKETSLIILPLLIVVILFELARTFDLRRFGLDMAPYLGITLFYFLVRLHVLHGLAPTVTPTSWLDMARTWPSVLWFYERHLILPIHSSILYDYDLVDRASLAAFWLPLGALLTSCAIAGFFLWKRWSIAVVVAVLLLILPIVLVLNFRVFYWRDLVHDRYLYTPSAGFCILAAITLVQAGAWVSKAISAVVQQLLAAGLLCALVLTTLAEAQPWRTNLSVLAHAVKVAPRNIGAQILLGDELESRNNFVEAKICYQNALQLTPSWGPAWFAYGRMLLLTGDSEGAIQSFRRAVVLDGSPIESVWLALALDKVGQDDEARALLARAFAQDPAMMQTSIDVKMELAAATSKR